jgi:hypothetical protein
MDRILNIENTLFGTMGPFVSEMNFLSEQKSMNFVDNYPMNMNKFFFNCQNGLGE